MDSSLVPHACVLLGEEVEVVVLVLVLATRTSTESMTLTCASDATLHTDSTLVDAVDVMESEEPVDSTEYVRRRLVPAPGACSVSAPAPAPAPAPPDDDADDDVDDGRGLVPLFMAATWLANTRTAFLCSTLRRSERRICMGCHTSPMRSTSSARSCSWDHEHGADGFDGVVVVDGVTRDLP